MPLASIERDRRRSDSVRLHCKEANMKHSDSNTLSDPLLTEGEAAEMRRQSIRTLQAERLRGGGCPFVKLGRSVRYRRSDVLRFIEVNTRTSTTEVTAQTAGAR